MPSPTPSPAPRPRPDPKYCLDKPSGRAFVLIDGRKVYLGRHGDEASRAAYHRLVGHWNALARPRGDPAAWHAGDVVAGRPPPLAGGLTVLEVILAFWAHAEATYPAPPVPEGKRPRGELGNFWDALRPLGRLYGETPAADFGPLALKTVREEMVRLGWCRNVVNRHVGRLKHVFKWAVENEKIPGEVHHRLSAVPGLRRGRTAARETAPVRPVPEQRVAAVLPLVSRQVRAMIELQLLTAMRPGEACAIRSGDVDTAARLWVYRPATHKTAHHEHVREVLLGPRARDVLAPFLTPDLAAHVFSPADAERERREKLSAARTTPASCGHVPGTNRSDRARRPPGQRYSVRNYRQAIERACDRAFPPPEALARRRVPARGRKGKRATRRETASEWRERLGPERWAELRKWVEAHRWHPHQLRHNAATRLRREFGLEVSRIILGHRTLTATQVYAERDLAAAADVVGRIG